MTETLPDNQIVLAVDSHVHLYALDQLELLLEAARINFAGSFALQGMHPPDIGILVLTDLPHKSVFSEIRQLIVQGRIAEGKKTSWQLSLTDEPVSMKACHSNGSVIYLLAGRQIISLEKIEVLAIGSLAEFAGNPSCEEIIAQIASDGACSILPWGVGKWLGSRGQVMNRILEASLPTQFCLGDNAGRPAFWKKISQFALARKKSIPIVRGTDPLPLPGQIAKVGQFFSYVRTGFDESKPAAALVRLLCDQTTPWHDAGNLSSMIDFLRVQVMLRVNKLLQR